MLWAVAQRFSKEDADGNDRHGGVGAQALVVLRDAHGGPSDWGHWGGRV
jgi:hypothetical protein